MTPQQIATLVEIRRALYEAYELECQYGEDYAKSSEMVCEVEYPSYWDVEVGRRGMMEPVNITIYSYMLGPSSKHYFLLDDEETHPHPNMWQSPDIFAKALEVAQQWKRNTVESLRKEGLIP